MAVLTLRLAGPLQSWGTGSRFTRRSTDDVPSKSGVIGMLAAARGLRRTDDLTELLGLRFGVRIDQPGVLVRDFQTARSHDGASVVPLSERFYRGDAVYLAAVEGPSALLSALAEAVRRPAFPLFLGRRSCPPAGPVPTRLLDGDLQSVLRTLEWQCSQWQARRNQESTVRVEIVHDADETPGDLVRDEPVSFDPAHRQYAWRQIVRYQWSVPNPHNRSRPEPDFMSHLE